MDAIREQLKKPLVVGIAAFIIGLIIGLTVLGWLLFPVKWVDADPEHLRYEAKVEYLHMAVEAFGYNRLADKAKARYDALGEEAAKIFEEVSQNPEGLSLEVVQSFRTVITSGLPPVGMSTPAIQATQAAPLPVLPTEQAPKEGGGLLGKLVPVLCVVAILIIAGVAAFFFLRSRSAKTSGGAPTPAMQAQQAARQAQWTDYSRLGEQPPVAQFMASYKLGDDLFDDSFSIDSPAGEFLGECGVSISETIGVGDPKKVTAFEVWLFDKGDIQTVTKVWMSAHAFNEEGIRQRLEAKGEPVLASPGADTILETTSLYLVAKVIDMGYGDSALPEESFFDRFILELAVWHKA